MSSWPLGSADIHLIRMAKQHLCVCVCVLIAKYRSHLLLRVSLRLSVFVSYLFPHMHFCTFERILESCTLVLVVAHLWVCEERGGTCLRGVLAGCPASRGDKGLSVVVVQRADTQTAAHTWLIVSLLGLRPADCCWAKASHPALPDVRVRACVCARKLCWEWWKAKTVRRRETDSMLWVCLSFYSLHKHMRLVWTWPRSEVGGSSLGWMWWEWSMGLEGKGFACNLLMFSWIGLCNVEGLKWTPTVSLLCVVITQTLWHLIYHANYFNPSERSSKASALTRGCTSISHRSTLLRLINSDAGFHWECTSEPDDWLITIIRGLIIRQRWWQHLVCFTALMDKILSGV